MKDSFKRGYLKEYISNTQQQKDKRERVINMITLEMSSIKKIKESINKFNKLYLVPEYEHKIISFSKKEFVHNVEAKITPIVLDIRMTHEGIDNCTVKKDHHQYWGHKEYFILQMLQRDGNK